MNSRENGTAIQQRHVTFMSVAWNVATAPAHRQKHRTVTGKALVAVCTVGGLYPRLAPCRSRSVILARLSIRSDRTVNGKALAAGCTVGGLYPGATDGQHLIVA